MKNNHKALLKTLIYSDIFQTPLTKKEFWQFLITEEEISKETFDALLNNLPTTISRSAGYYFLSGHKKFIKSRERRKKVSKEKISYAQKIARKLQYIPTIYFVGISGSVAAYNATKAEDIDLFIITKKQTVFVTRLLLVLFLGFLKVRRKPNQKHNLTNLFCLNFIIDETQMNFAKQQDMYIAHEIAQVIPLWDRKNTYKIFLDQNSWVKNFMPNSLSDRAKYINLTQSVLGYILCSLIRIGEPFAYLLQIWYMDRRRTSEKITKNSLAFHPVDYRKKTLSVYYDSLKKYGFDTRGH